MIDHVSIPVDNLERAAAFYDAVLGALDLVRRKQRPGAIGYGPESRPAPTFWILEVYEGDDGGSAGVARAGLGLHISFMASTRSMVDAFFDTAVANGGADAGAPGERPHYTRPFYGAFVFDPDGFKIEAVCRASDDGA